MAEYIDKQIFNDAIREAVRKYPSTFYNGLETARQIAHDMKAADVEPVTGWIPVTERLPETDDEVVVAFKNSEDGEWWYRIDNFVDGIFCYDTAFKRNIEYWMPLPKPPKEVSE